MVQQAKYILGFIGIVTLVYTSAQNSSLLPFTFAPQGYCRETDGTLRKIGDVWKPSPLSSCSCTAGQFIQCLMILPPLTLKPIVIVCVDSQGNTRKSGDMWLDNPQSKCRCTDQNFVSCEFLSEPMCQDISGTFRKNAETWMNNSCVECACVNGSINCNKTVVNITYGLYKISKFPTCEHCETPQTLSACKAFRDNRLNLIECERKGFYIRDIHRCNGNDECPDGSDEKGCENVKCKDEEGGTFLMNDKVNGWKVSPCLSCHCKGGLTACKKTLTINFPGYFKAVYSYMQNCKQPSCSVLKFVRENKEWCQGAELVKNKGIIFEGQTWKSGECSFYFPGARKWLGCPAMERPVCYVYNGAVCCASECPGLQEIGSQMRGNLTFCPSGRQLESASSQCRHANNCSRNFNIQNCSSVVTCHDEDSNQYFEGTTWSVGACIKCSCVRGKIHCSRTVVFVSFLQLIAATQGQFSLASDQNFTEHCNQTKCNAANFMKANKGICNACRWNNKLYYDGDHWKENGVDFYCSSSGQKVRPGCYVENTRVKCTGAIPGLQELSLISKHDLFLCDSGDEIRSIGERCNGQPVCEDRSDERDCNQYYCPDEIANGFLWNRTQVDKEVLRQCSLIDPSWTGVFGSKCNRKSSKLPKTFWLHKTTCDCENKTLVEYFKRKIAGVNATNFMNISQELASSAQAKEFNNPRVFHDIFKQLFDNVTTRLLTPLTEQNADAALQYAMHVINTVLDVSAYAVRKSFFCVPKLAYDRNSLADKALEFLRQAPNNTIAYNTGSTLQLRYVENPFVTLPFKNNFLRPRPELSLVREELILQLNTAPLVQAVVSTPVTTTISSHKNVTRNDTKTAQKNTTDGLSDNQINDLLKAHNCTKLTFDEERGIIVYHADVSKEYQKHENIQDNMELVLLCISITAIFLALIFLSVLRLKKTERIFIHKSLLLSLGVGNLVYVLDTALFAMRQEHAALCTAVTVIQNYLHTAVFTWMLVEGINLYIKLVKVFSVKSRYTAYVGIGWGIPAVIVGLVAAIRPSTFDMSKPLTKDVTCGALKLTGQVKRTRCWINGSLWIYKGPILAILVVNLVLFVILLRVIFGKIASKYRNNHVIAAKKGLRSTIALLPLLGITWLVGFFLEFHYAVGYLFILLNSTQGVVFCIFHCVLDDQVQDAVRKLRVRIKGESNSRTRQTPLSNPNTTSVMERNSGVNMLQYSVDESTTRNGSIKNGTQSDETHL